MSHQVPLNQQLGTIQTPFQRWEFHIVTSWRSGLIGRSYDDEATQKDKKVLPYKAWSGQGMEEFEKFQLWKFDEPRRNHRITMATPIEIDGLPLIPPVDIFGSLENSSCSGS